MNKNRIMNLSLAGLLIAVGLIIPMFSPIKIVLEPASFTLASHVAIFIAIFISPFIAVSVALGTAIGFLLGGFPIIVVMRAATHIIFVIIAALYLHKISKKKLSKIKLRIFSVFIALIHALGEIIAVSFFYFGGNIGVAYHDKGFFVSVLLLVGLGTFVHSIVDFEIAHIIILSLKRQKKLGALFDKC